MFGYRTLHGLRAVWAGLLVPAVACGAAPATDLQGFVLAGPCLECHGAVALDPAAIPSLAGRSATDIVQALAEFRAGTRAGTVMPRLARGYDAAEVGVLADWLARNPHGLR